MEDNSVLLEQSIVEEVAGIADKRKSMSQPSLAVREPEGPSSNSTTPKQKMSTAQSTSNIRDIPIVKTWHENEELKGEIYSLKTEVQMYARKYSEAKEACHRSVQEVLDEFVSLKFGQEEMEDKKREFEAMRKEFYAMQEKLEDSQDALVQQAAEFEQQKRAMEQKIRELESDANNLTYGSLHGNLDDILKKNDPNYTLTGYEEKRINQLELDLMAERELVVDLENQIIALRAEVEDQSARLADADNLRAQLEAASGQGILGPTGAASNATFQIGNARESQTEEQIKYIDELETKLKASTSESDKARLALVEYMNRCSKLENDIHMLKKNTMLDQSTSILTDGKTAEELRTEIVKVNEALNELRAENRQLRIRCDQLNGGDGNLSVSMIQRNRMMAGMNLNNSSIPNETGGTSMQVFPKETSQQDLLNESNLPYLDTTAADRNKKEFDAAWAQFKGNETFESSLNYSMPPPDRDATNSFLFQKGFKNSPIIQKSIQLHQDGEQIQNNSFSTKTASVLAAPILQDVQHILDSSAILLEGQHNGAVNVEKMQQKMTLVREALSRLFERLKSSAALFEEILETNGASSPLAERIKQMKLAFETSMCDHKDVSGFLEAAEKDLTNMSLNYSILEKSVVSQSFVNDVSKRFSIAPGVEDIASSSLLNASYSPIFKFSETSHETERLQKEVADLKSELERVRIREMKSPLQNSPNRLSDVQIKAAQNFEELEVCQATLKKVETEKAVLASEIADLEDQHRQLAVDLGEVRSELNKALNHAESEQRQREELQASLDEANKLVVVMKKNATQQSNEVLLEMERRVKEAREQVEASSQALIKRLEEELRSSLAEENSIRDYMQEMSVEMEKLKKRTHEAEGKLEEAVNEKQLLIGQMGDLEDQIEKLSAFEKESTDCAAKMAARKKEAESARLRDELEKEAIEGLERIRKEISELTKKKTKAQIIKGNASSIRLVCDELCRRLTQERALQHEQAETLALVNDKMNQMVMEKESAIPEKENTVPQSSGPAHPGNVPSSKTPSSKFICPTRQLLHESTMAVDAIVQKLKKTHTMTGMGAELKETVANLITESRTLRDFLHQKLNLFKGIDVTNWKNETVEQLIERIEQCLQDNLILEEEVRKYKKELKKVAAIPSLSADVQERIKREIGGIAKDMGAVKGLRAKK